MQLDIKRILRDGRKPPMPQYQTVGAAAFDLAAFIPAPVIVPPRGSAFIPTGIAIALPPSACALVLARSGLAFKHGVGLINGVGLIDSDYRGEIVVGLINQSDTPYTVEDGQRVAQLLIARAQQIELREVGDLTETARGGGGFGSTGK